jgi:hypothetical protein
MKKSYLLVASVLLGTALNAQVQNKNGVDMLPVEGEYSIGISADPFLNYFGQIFSNAGAIAPTWDFQNFNNTIIGKKMMANDMAYRGIIRVGFGSTSNTSMRADNDDTLAITYPTLRKEVADVHKTGYNYVGIGGGIEKRRGTTRLQGIYGADALLWFSGNKDTYTYGNDLRYSGLVNPGDAASVSTNFGSNMVANDGYGNSARVLTSKSGMNIGFGVRAFAGVEYFILPKISLGAEFGWGLGLSLNGANTTSRESMNASTVSTQEVKTGKSSSFVLDVDRNAFGTGNGTLRLNFYF